MRNNLKHKFKLKILISPIEKIKIKLTQAFYYYKYYINIIKIKLFRKNNSNLSNYELYNVTNNGIDTNGIQAKVN